MAKRKTRRLKILKINTSILVKMLEVGRYHEYAILEGLPSDAEIIDSEFTFATSVIALKISSKTFEEVPEGAVIPYMDVIVKKI